MAQQQLPLTNPSCEGGDQPKGTKILYVET
jgi:hypothetical protein